MKKNLCLVLLSLFLLTGTVAQNFNTDSLKQKLQFSRDDTPKVNLLFNLSYAYLFAYADSSAIYAKQGLELAQKIDYKRGEATCMQMLCLSLTNFGNFTSALDFGFKSLTISKILGDTLLMVYSNNALMGCYMAQEDYKEALRYGYDALNLLKPPYRDIPQAAVVLGLISGIYEKTNQLDSALFYAEKSYHLYKEWSGIFEALGDIHYKLGHTDLALSYYRKGISIAKDSSTYVGLISVYNDISKVFESIGKIDSSIYYAEKSIMQEGIHSNPEGVLLASSQLAHLYELKGIADSTIKYQKLIIVLKDSLFGRQKTREAQTFSFNEKLHQQEISTQKQQDENKIKMYVLLTVIIIFLLIGFFLWRNNRHKQITNSLLQQQKEKVESTLSELKLTQAQLIQSEKMASLGELTAGIAHEIQNPLNFVNNFSEVNNELVEEIKNENNIDEIKAIAEDIKQNSEKILFHGKRADAIVKNMLQHSYQTKSTKELTDINALCDEYLRLSYHGLRAKDKSFNADFKTDFDESVGKINIVPQDIGRVLLNLINNAFYAVNEKKKNVDESYQPLVSVQTKKLNDKVEITVNDNGNGIPQNIIDKIFQPFFTTKPTGQGTGLGLSLAYDIITKEHNGTIKANSKEGEGSEFIIQLPITA